MLAIFIIVGVAYFITSRKIDQWETMRLLEEPGQCPGPFLRNPLRYRCVSYVLFFGFIASGVYAPEINGWMVAVIVGLTCVFSARSGKAAGFKKYRSVAAADKALFSGPDYANDPETPRRIDWCERRMAITNAELQEKINRAIRGHPHSRRNTR